MCPAASIATRGSPTRHPAPRALGEPGFRGSHPRTPRSRRRLILSDSDGPPDSKKCWPSFTPCASVSLARRARKKVSLAVCRARRRQRPPGASRRGRRRASRGACASTRPASARVASRSRARAAAAVARFAPAPRLPMLPRLRRRVSTRTRPSDRAHPLLDAGPTRCSPTRTAPPTSPCSCGRCWSVSRKSICDGTSTAPWAPAATRPL